MSATHLGKQSASVCLAITRLRLGIVACCWIIGLALACQALVWSLAVFTDLRFDATAEAAAADAPLIVHAEPQQTQGRILPQINGRNGTTGAAAPNSETSAPGETTVDPKVLTTYDALFGYAADVAGGAGRLAMLALLALMALGVMLSASGSVPGVERSVSAFMWTVLVAALVLPLGGAMMLPWDDGALTTYEHIAHVVDQQGAEAQQQSLAAGLAALDPAQSTLLFYGRFLLFPVACIVGIALVGLQYCAGLEAAVLQRESMKLDPVLEKEAANVKPSSLHGSRSASILSRTVTASAPETSSAPTATHRRTAQVVGSTIEERAEESPPKRLI